VERFESLLKVGLVGGNPLLADIRRIADDDVETALLEHLRESGLPIEGPGVYGRVGDDTVADADAVVEARECLAQGQRPLSYAAVRTSSM
jgi:hypothetical protein